MNAYLYVMRKVRFNINYLLFLIFILFSAIAKGQSQFVGQFNSWLNVKTGFGAKGDGVTDDTHALQSAINAAANGAVNITLYLPAGKYIISRTLTLNFSINVSIIGADPNNTVITWAGASKGTMFQVNGTAYSKICRLTFNGNNIAAVAVDQSWDGSKPHFDTSNAYTDDIFTDVGIGIRGGGLNHGFAETTILRDQFIRNNIAGVSLGNFNALDVWIRNCLFNYCATGVTNTAGAGNFKLYSNNFINSSLSDISIGNTGEFTIRNNTSINAAKFFYAGYTRNPAPIIIEENTILDPVNTEAVTISNQGPVIFINNTIRSRQSATSGPAAHFNNSNTVSSGNTFTVAGATNGLSYNNKLVSYNSLSSLKIKPLPVAKKHVNRKVFEIPAGANCSVIQAIINKAVKLKSLSPIIHFPYGTYAITSPIFIPANVDLQITGDGYGNQHASTLVWKGNTNGPIIAVAGPGKVTIQDITLKGNFTSTNILITNADEAGSRVYLENFNQQGGGTGLISNKLDHTLIFAYDSQFSGLKKAISVIGGSLAAIGKPAEGRTILYSGAESNNTLSHEITNGGNLLIQDTWYEGNIKSTYAKLSGNSIFTAAGDRIATPLHSDIPAVWISDFSGKATFLASDLNGFISVNGNCAKAKILLLGLMTEDKPFFVNHSFPKTDLRSLFCRTREDHTALIKSGSYAVDDTGIYDHAWVDDMLKTAKVEPIDVDTSPAATGDIRLFHVMSINGAIGIDIEGPDH